MFVEEYKNSLLQNYVCKRCGRVWDEDGEEIQDNYIADKVRKSAVTLTVICPMCEFDEKGSKMYVSL